MTLTYTSQVADVAALTRNLPLVDVLVSMLTQ